MGNERALSLCKDTLCPKVRVKSFDKLFIIARLCPNLAHMKYFFAENNLAMIPQGNNIEDIKEREKIIRDFYREWKEKNPSQRKFNLSLKEYINIRMVSIVETSEHAAKSYLSTLAVLQLDSILTGAKRVSMKKPKPSNANQKPFERIMIMEYELTGIGKIKMTVGVRRRTLEKVQYCITAISSE